MFHPYHTTYTRNNMRAIICEGNCGLWVLNEIIKKIYPENLKKIVGAVWELPAMYIPQPIQPISTQIGLDWLYYLAGNSQRAPTIFFKFSGYIF